MKVGKVSSDAGKHHGWAIWCPACEFAHVFDTRWEFNGDRDLPTFKGSYLQHGSGSDMPRCHLYVTNGMIEFLPDCSHDMAGTTVPLPDMPT